MVSPGFRQAADHQTVTMTFFLLQVWLWEVLWSFFLVQPLSWSSPGVINNPLFHCTSQSDRETIVYNKRRRRVKMMFLICSQFMRHPLIKLFHLSNLLQMLNSHRMVNIEFFGNFSSSCKRVSFDDGSQLVVVNFRWPPLRSSSSRLRLLCRTSWTTAALYRRLQCLGQVRCWCCELSPLLYNPFWTWIRKSLKFAFLSSIISIEYI